MTKRIKMADKNSKKSLKFPKPAKKPHKTEAAAPVEPKISPEELIIVGIGASAGGLEALGAFFDSLPPDTGMVFVVVTHLHPEHESHLAELLQRHTQMPAMQVSKNVQVRPNHVYVIPPNRSIRITKKQLETLEFDQTHDRRTPINYFFRSLAASGYPNLIAMILSGGGTDGAAGIKDVKEVGGLIMVQHPDNAGFDSMPRAALSTGLVDVVLPVEHLAAKLLEYIRHRPRLSHDPGQLIEAEAETLQRILAQVRPYGHDFSQALHGPTAHRAAYAAVRFQQGW